MNSSRPYLVRALYDWIVDNGCTPYVLIDAHVQGVEVPQQYVKDGQIVLNISPGAVANLLISNDDIRFRGRFGGIAVDVFAPVRAVLGIYARENGQGMAFPVAAQPEGGTPVEGSPLTSVPAAGGGEEPGASHMQLVPADAPVAEADDAPQPPKSPAGGGPRPALKRIK
jgi:stringent starvation protein B